MKTWLTVVLIGIMLVSVPGCYNAGYYDQQADDDSSASDKEPSSADWGDTIASGADDSEDSADDSSNDDNGEFEDDLFEDTSVEDIAETDDSFEDGESSGPVGSQASAGASGSASTKGTLTGTTLTVMEGDLVELQVEGKDPDGDDLTYTFSAPLDSKGRWQTKAGDAGSYTVVVTATDGTTTVEKTVKVVVLEQNSAPAIKLLRDVVVKEGESFNLQDYLDFSDPEGDEVKVTYSGWMTEARRTTTYDDAGEYDVTVAATDGDKSASLRLKVTVQDVNRAPEFDIVLQ